MASSPAKPLITIVGATGTGKSDLAVEIAGKFNGEIINGDAMQLYRGLPIITNKISGQEQKGVMHHLLGCIDLEQETWTVNRFVREATRVVRLSNIRRGKLPILVGGTHYYTQSLLFPDTLPEEVDLEAGEKNQRPSILNEATEVLYTKLQQVDPVIANRWHPNDRQKIQRSLEIYLNTGKQASQIYDEQRIQRALNMQNNIEAAHGNLRYPSLIFWTYANKVVMSSRLNDRIDKMLERGLLSEVKELNSFRRARETSTGTRVDQTRGIWPSIGYKEFIEYDVALSEQKISAVKLESLKTQAIERTQAATRQYAKRQIKWIQIKLLLAMRDTDQAKRLFLLDTSDLTKRNQEVIDPALDITGKFLEGDNLPMPSQVSPAVAEMLMPKREYDLSSRPDLWGKKTCQACCTVTVTPDEWTKHVNSRAHRRRVSSINKNQDQRIHKTNKDLKASQEDIVDVLKNYQSSLTEKDKS